MESNPRAVIGANGPPDAIDTALEPFADLLMEVANWTDGALVENAGQLEATNALLKDLKRARKAVDEARDEETRPLHSAWKDAVARWKPTQDDLDRQVSCIVAAQGPFKKRLADEKAEAARKAREEADAKAEAARQAHIAANAANLDEQRAADDLLKEADEAKKAASRAAKDTVKGMRTVHHHEVTSHKALLGWIAANDRDALAAFVEDYAARNFRTRPMDGVRTWESKEAF